MVSNRVLPLAARYVFVLLAALLVYYVIRDPLYIAVGNISFPWKESLYPTQPETNQDGLAAIGGEGADGKVPIEEPAAGTAQDTRDKELQAPIDGENHDVAYVKKYKPEPVPLTPIGDHFPWITYSGSPPRVLDNNLPPNPHVDEVTPLLIGFTTNWPLLLQCVSSYIAAGWPPGDIHVVENTGTFSANRKQQLELQNPFFLNHTALELLGVKVLATPTLLSFAQLQNFFLHTAVERDWPFFWWSHMDVLVFSDEEVKKNDRDHDWDHDPYATIYERAVGLLRYLNRPDMPPWATHFFDYDHLALVNRNAYIDAGAWDTHIPYAAADCDMYLRLHWAGYWQPQSEAGLIFDVATALDDISALFRVPGAHATFKGDPVFAELGNSAVAEQQKNKNNKDPAGSERAHRDAELKREQDMWPWVDKEGETFAHLIEVAGRMQEVKWAGQKRQQQQQQQKGVQRQAWQGRQRGGHDDPFYRDADGFRSGVETLTDAGRRIFADKWGHRGCDLLTLGVEAKDAWRLERDWDVAAEGLGAEGGSWGKDWMTGANE